MRKQNILYNVFRLLFINLFNESVATIQHTDYLKLKTESLFNFQNDIQKQELSQHLIHRRFHSSFDFNGLTIKSQDFSGLCLKDIDFSGGTFIDVKFNHSDLREATFENVNFQEVDFTDAILYYPFDVSEEEVHEKGFKIHNWDHYHLVTLYSDLMKNVKFDLINGLGEESIESLKKARCLNKFFPALRLNLSYKDLKGFDLRKIDLKNANLLNSELQTARLSENIIVPNYSTDNKTELFNKWVNGTPEEQKAYQKLVNAQFNLTKGISIEILRQGLQLKKNLQNADLSEINLQGVDLTGANLKNACLYKVQLQKAILSKNVVVPNYPEGNTTELFNKWVNGTPEEQEAYQKLVNAQFNITEGVPVDILCKGIKLKKNLQNTNLSFPTSETVDLSKADLTYANLKELHFYKVNLSGANLMRANLQGASLQQANLQGANLMGANLQGTSLQYANLQEADLTKSNLQNTSLVWAKLRKANLMGANLTEANLYNAWLQKARLSENVIVPNYSSGSDVIKLFMLWIDGTLEQQEAYQKLVNARFWMTQDVDARASREFLRRGIKLKKNNLQNACLAETHLEGVDLSGANLQNTNFNRAYLQEANLSGANLCEANLSFANLQGTCLSAAQLSNAYFLPPNCKDEDLPRIYRECNDQAAKNILKIILECKEISIL